LTYPACKLTKGFEIPGQEFTYLVDFAWLSAMSYETPAVTKHAFTMWFGKEDVVVDETEFVAAYRNASNTDNKSVSYKLYSIPSLPGAGVVAVRGTQNPTDSLVNMQLWSSSMLTQLVRAIMPLGWIWNPILDDLIQVVNLIQSDRLKDVSYYHFTTDFVNDLLENNYTYNGQSFDLLRITGVSLGGGIAMITGAQTRANAVALAGVNSVLARKTFEPPLSMEALNTRVFNLIPARDPISHIGDHGRLFQEIACRAPANNPSGCHSFWRQICELQYSCGSAPRPVLCKCVETYGYPEPIQNGTRTFEQACAEEKAISAALGR
jgi:lipase ATG15